jgi:ribosomal protein L18E
MQTKFANVHDAAVNLAKIISEWNLIEIRRDLVDTVVEKLTNIRSEALRSRRMIGDNRKELLDRVHVEIKGMEKLLDNTNKELSASGYKNNYLIINTISSLVDMLKSIMLDGEVKIPWKKALIEIYVELESKIAELDSLCNSKYSSVEIDSMKCLSSSMEKDTLIVYGKLADNRSVLRNVSVAESLLSNTAAHISKSSGSKIKKICSLIEILINDHKDIVGSI